MAIFDWKKRLEIAIGAAKGLEYLHTDCTVPIVHRDVKPENILLDRNMEAKIADFGLSKIFEDDMKSYITTMMKGTPGYIDPECRNNRLIVKSDVYSFGIVLLQLVTGLPVIIKGNENVHISDWVRAWYEKGAVTEIVDRRLDNKYNSSSIWKVADLALACASRESAQRPTMDEVVEQLKHCLDLETPPEKCPATTDSVKVIPANDSMFFNVHAK